MPVFLEMIFLYGASTFCKWWYKSCSDLYFTFQHGWLYLMLPLDLGCLHWQPWKTTVQSRCWRFQVTSLTNISYKTTFFLHFSAKESVKNVFHEYRWIDKCCSSNQVSNSTLLEREVVSHLTLCSYMNVLSIWKITCWTVII